MLDADPRLTFYEAISEKVPIKQEELEDLFLLKFIRAKTKKLPLALRSFIWLL